MTAHDIKAILFDLDGTLLDTHDLLLAAFRYATRTVLNKVIPDKVLMAKVGQPLDAQMWDFTNDVSVHDELCRVYRAHTDTLHDDMVKPFPDTALMLERLKEADIPLGVITSKRHELAARGLGLFDLNGYFNFLIGADDWPSHKPHPGPVLHGCDLLGLSCRACLYVGDSPFDMQAGTSAGCPTAAALWGMFPREVLAAQHPTFMCSQGTEIPQLLIK